MMVLAFMAAWWASRVSVGAVRLVVYAARSMRADHARGGIPAAVALYLKAP